MSNYFEGWYFKHQKGEEMLAVIAGRANNSAFIQIITQQNSYRVDYPLSAYRENHNLEIGENRFTRSGITLSIKRKGLELSGNLSYKHLKPIHKDIMGPFRFFPMQCKHTVVSMNHSLTGEVLLNGKRIDFNGGKGYIERDSGRSFPKSYTWVQCNDFEADCSIMASAAHIPFGFWNFWGCICVVMLNGKEYRIATYLGAKILHRDKRQLVLVQKNLTLRVLFLKPHVGHSLVAPVKGKMIRNIREVPAAPAYFELLKDNNVLFRAKSLFASYEYVV